MRVVVFMLSMLIANTLSAQDPTLPNKTILARLRGEPIANVTQELPMLPTIKLKAIVMVDKDHGNAIVEANGQRLYLQLDRAALETSHTNADSSKLVPGIQIGSTTYRLEAFSDRSIVLNDGGRRVYVQ